jgi:hypothetical protein
MARPPSTSTCQSGCRRGGFRRRPRRRSFRRRRSPGLSAAPAETRPSRSDRSSGRRRRRVPRATSSVRTSATVRRPGTRWCRSRRSGTSSRPLLRSPRGPSRRRRPGLRPRRCRRCRHFHRLRPRSRRRTRSTSSTGHTRSGSSRRCRRRGPALWAGSTALHSSTRAVRPNTVRSLRRSLRSRRPGPRGRHPGPRARHPCPKHRRYRPETLPGRRRPSLRVSVHLALPFSDLPSNRAAADRSRRCASCDERTTVGAS